MQGIHGQTQIRSTSVAFYEADKTFVVDRETAPLTTFQDVVGVTFGVGADVATPFTGTARFKVIGSFLSEDQARGE